MTLLRVRLARSRTRRAAIRTLTISRPSRRSASSRFILSTVLHLQGVPALGWLVVEPTPGPYVKEMIGAAQFWTNKILKDYKGKCVLFVSFSHASSRCDSLGTRSMLNGQTHSLLSLLLSLSTSSSGTRPALRGTQEAPQPPLQRPQRRLLLLEVLLLRPLMCAANYFPYLSSTERGRLSFAIMSMPSSPRLKKSGDPLLSR